MTGKKLILYFFVQWIIFLLLKILFFRVNIFANPGLQEMIFWIITVIVSVVVVRKFGVISFFEAFLIIAVWFVAGALLDLIITSLFTTSAIFSTKEYWVGWLLFALSIFTCHKKRHVHIRHELHAKAHANHGSQKH